MKFNDGATFFTVEQLSPRREKTPEGFLLCKGVPISRVGDFDYTPRETGIAGNGGKVVMSRSESELFKPETMASFEGKPVVIGHSQFADPDNWRTISVGHVQNVRRGEGDQSSLLLADLLLQDSEGIRLVEDGRLTEVSCGYDAKAIDDGNGRGHQVGIVGNHVALVSKARCGHICKIGDGSMETKPSSVKSMIRRLFRDGDEEGLNDTLDGVEITPCKDAEGEQTATAEERIVALEEAIRALTERVDELATPPVADEEVEEQEQPEDNVASSDEVEQVMSDAEDIAPGFARPTADSADGRFTRSCLERVKRSALKAAAVTQFGDSASLEGQALDVAFKAAVALKRADRNPRARFNDGASAGRPTNADLNNKFKSYWEGK